MFIFGFLNLIVGLSAWLWTRKYFSQKASRIDFILIFAAVFLAQIILSEIILGFFQKLNLFNLIIINMSFLTLSWFFLRRRQPSVISEVTIVPDNRIALFSISVILGFVLIKVLINLFNPSFGWDSLNYHFTFPVEWMKHGNLVNPITINDDPTPTYYPLNGCLFYLWLIFPFKSVFLADVGQLPFFILAFLAVYNICLKINLKKEFAFYAAAAFIIIPNFLKQIEVGYADIMVAGLFLLSLNFLIQFYEEPNLKNLMLSGLSLGLLLGTKTVALTWTFVLSIFLVVCLLSAFVKRKIRTANLFAYLILFLALLILLGGYSYLRNFIQTGNPLYPFKYELLGKTVFDGVMPKTTYLAHWSSEDYNLTKLFLREGMGIQLVFLYLPGIFLGLWFVCFRESRSRILLYYLAILPFVLYVIFRLFIPQLWTRFLYPFLGVSSIMTFYGLDRINFSSQALRCLLVVIMLTSAAELSGHAELIFSLVLSGVFFFYFIKILPRLAKNKIPLAIKLVLFISLILFLETAHFYHDRNEFKNYVKRSSYWPEATEAWSWLNEHTKGENIAYVGRPLPFPLYGEKFKNEVYYVSVNDKAPYLHAFKNGHYEWDVQYENLHKNLEDDGNYREKADFNIWLKNLRERKTDMLFIYTLHQTDIFPIEDIWAQAHSEIFRLVFKNDMVHIYGMK